MKLGFAVTDEINKSHLLYAFFWVIPQHQTPVNYSEESIQHSEHGESLKSRAICCFAGNMPNLSSTASNSWALQ
jgi:hypothetical protein